LSSNGDNDERVAIVVHYQRKEEIKRGITGTTKRLLLTAVLVLASFFLMTVGTSVAAKNSKSGHWST
jgi:hypothetical protein